MTVLHIGLDKTGSTAIQMACVNNKEALLAMSILYPSTDTSQGQLGSCFYKEPGEYIHNIELGRQDSALIAFEDAHYLQELDKEIHDSRASTMILSSESFGFMEAEAVHAMKTFLAKRSRRILVVMYCRPPLSYAASAVSQRARTGRPVWSDPPLQEIKKVCCAYEDAFGRDNIVMRPFVQGQLHAGDVRLDFFSILGMSAQQMQQTLLLGSERDNSTLSADGLLVADALRRSHDESPLSSIDFSMKYEPLLRTIGGGQIRLTGQQIEEVLAGSRPHVDYAARVYGVSLAEPERVQEGPVPYMHPDALKSLGDALRRLAQLERVPSNVLKDIRTPALIMGSMRVVGGIDVEYGHSIGFEIDILLAKAVSNLELGIHIHDTDQQWIFGTNTRLLGQKFEEVVPGSYRVTYHILANLPVGEYTAGFAFTERLRVGETQLAWFGSLCHFRVSRTDESLFGAKVYLPTHISCIPTSLARESAVITDFRGGLAAACIPMTMAPGECAEITVLIANESEQDWMGDNFRPVHLACRWRVTQGQQSAFEGERIALPAGGVHAGHVVSTKVTLSAPALSATYELVISLVQEHVAWFDDAETRFRPTRHAVVVQSGTNEEKS
jgi:hypothetical protein